MFNKIILMGRLTKDPELKTTQSGVTMCRFSIAVDRAYSKQGEEKQTDFFDITAWRNTAEFVSKYFSKGRMIHIEGKLQNNNYTDQNGVKQYRNAIIADSVSFCGDKSNNQQNGGGQSAPPAQQPYQNQYQQPQQGYQQPYAQPQQYQQPYAQPQQNYGQPQNYQQGYAQNQGYNQPPQNYAPPQGSYQQPQPQQNQTQGYPQNNQPPPQPQPIELSDLGDFEELISDDEVPF